MKKEDSQKQFDVTEDIGTPVRIAMRSSRSETQAHLFDAVYGNEESSGYPDGSELTHLSSADEELMGILPDDEEEETNSEKQNASPEQGEELLELITEGRMQRLIDPETGAETVTLSYPESELTGMQGSQSSIIFRTDDPGLIHMVRTGTVSTALTFRAHCRAICMYDTPYMPFQVGIHSLLVDNSLLETGRLTLEYIIEIRGAQAERCRMEMTVAPEEIHD